MAEARLAGDPRRRRPAREHRAVARHVPAGVRRAPALPRARPAAQAVLPQRLPQHRSAATCSRSSASPRPWRTITTARRRRRSATRCSRRGLAHRTAQKVLVLLGGILGRAKRKGWIAANPCENAEKVTVRRSDEFNVLDVEQVHAVARAAARRAAGGAVHGRRVHRAAAGRAARAALAARRLREPHPARPAQPPGRRGRGGHAEVASRPQRPAVRSGASSRSTGSAAASTSPAPTTSCSATTSAGTARRRGPRRVLRRARGRRARAPAREGRPDRLPRPAAHVRDAVRREGHRPVADIQAWMGHAEHPDDDALPALRAAARRRRAATAAFATASGPRHKLVDSGCGERG